MTDPTVSDWSPPSNHTLRPVTILGTGPLARHIAASWLSTGFTVHIHDPSPDQLIDALIWIKNTPLSMDLLPFSSQPSPSSSNTGTPRGSAVAFTGLTSALEGAWLVIDTSPENLLSKEANLADLEALAPKDAILTTGKDLDGKVPRIFALDINLASTPTHPLGGSLIELLHSPSGKTTLKPLIPDLFLPDGLAFDNPTQRLFWTNMGIPGQPNGSIYSCLLDGSDVQTIMAPGTIPKDGAAPVNTPKQVVVDGVGRKLYFCDREGMRVLRCGMDGSELEVLVQTGDVDVESERKDATRWCAGVAVALRLGRLYWTQKGPSKGGQGRIFSAGLEIPAGTTASTREDIVVVAEDLPEPVDLAFHEETRTLYWTDRGELPFGNSLNRMRLDEAGLVLPQTEEWLEQKRGRPMLTVRHEVLARNLHEAVGLTIDMEKGHVYVADMGGAVYRFGMDGEEKVKVVEEEGRAWTGVVFV